MSLDVKQQRLQRLQAQLNEQARAISETMVGSTQRVLVERPSKKDAQRARRQNREQPLGEFRGPASLIGQFVDVAIVKALPQSLRGRLATVAPEGDARLAVNSYRCPLPLQSNPSANSISCRRTTRGSRISVARSMRTCGSSKTAWACR